MSSKYFIAGVIAVSFSALLGAGYLKHTESALTAPVQHNITSEEVKQIIKTYLVENPEVIEESMRALYTKKAKAESEKATQTIQSKLSDIENDPTSPKVGSDSAKIKIVEFFDYNCGYCKQMAETKVKLLETMKDDIQFIFKEVPVLGEPSKLAAKAALAVNKVDSSKYFAFQTEMLRATGPKNYEDIAKKVGVDMVKFKAALEDKALDDILANNAKLTQEIGIRGTPAYIIGGELVPGFMDYNQMKEMIDSKLKPKQN